MKKLLLALTATAALIVFSVANAGESFVTVTHFSEPTNMLFFGIGLFLVSRFVQKSKE